MGKSAVTVNSEAAAADATARGVQLLKESKETKLSTLDLSVNGVTPAGAEPVAAMLAVTASLTSLDVSCNNI